MVDFGQWGLHEELQGFNEGKCEIKHVPVWEKHKPSLKEAFVHDNLWTSEEV